MGLGPNCCQLENETCYLLKVSKYYVEEKICILQTRTYIMQRGRPHGTKF